MVPIEKQIAFYTWQLHEIAKEWHAYYTSSVETLMMQKDCYLGEVYGFDTKRGNLIVKFPISKGPRLEMLYSFYFLKDNKRLTDSFKDFAKKANQNGENVSTLYHIEQDDKYIYTAINNIEFEIFQQLKSRKDQGLSTFILLGKPEPPIAYLLRLRAFTEANKNAGILNIDTTSTYSLKFFEADKVSEILLHLQQHDTIVIQGPPGTGKSTLVAELLGKIHKGNKIVVTALANKALLELAKKIDNIDLHRRIYKTNLSYQEKKDLPFLQSCKNLKVEQSSLLLTTYYKLSELIIEDRSEGFLFDYLIIEEASQAFYTTIIAFKKLTKKLIIIGDPLQLSPIVRNENIAKSEIHMNIEVLINGLGTYMDMYPQRNYFLQNTYRLNYYNTMLTNSFYDGRLISENAKTLSVLISAKYKALFNEEKPTQLWLQGSLAEKHDIERWSLLFRDLLIELNAHTEELEVSVLTSFREDVGFLQELLSIDIKKSKHKIIIETVDRVQGLTVDINFYLLRFGGATKFILKKNRFNVATSRARFYNIIVTDQNYQLLLGHSSKEVKTYFEKLN